MRYRATPPARSTSRRCGASSGCQLPSIAPKPKPRKRSIALAAESAELKLLRRAPGREVFVPPGIDQLKAASQRGGQGSCIVAADDEAAASFRPVRREGSDNGMSARPQSAPKAGDVSTLVVRKGKKVERRPVVPEIVALRRLPGGHVGSNPSHPIGFFAHARSRRSQRRSRDVEYRQVLIAPRHQTIGQPRGSSADVDDGGGFGRSDKVDQFKRERRSFLKPAHLIFALGGVDALPVALTASFAHQFSSSPNGRSCIIAGIGEIGPSFSCSFFLQLRKLLPGTGARATVTAVFWSCRMVARFPSKWSGNNVSRCCDHGLPVSLFAAHAGIVFHPGVSGGGSGHPDPASHSSLCLYAAWLGPGVALLLLFGSLIGSYFNIPITVLPGTPVRSGQIVDFFGMQYVVPVVVQWPGTVLAVNVGGAVIPTVMSTYLVIRYQLWLKATIATVVIALIIHAMATPVAGIGIAVPVFAPVVATAILAFILSREYAPPLAYIGGSMGTLIGADLLNLDKIGGLGAPVASIGGAGTFDGIFPTGILAVLLAGLASPSRPRPAW